MCKIINRSDEIMKCVSLVSFARDLSEGVLNTFELGLSVIWVGALADFLDLFSDLLFGEVIKLKTGIGFRQGSTKHLLIFTLKSTSGIIDHFSALSNQLS